VVLRAYRYPEDSIGNEFHEEPFSTLITGESLDVYFVELIHGDARKAFHLAEPLARLLGHVEQKHDDAGRECCFLVNVYRERDPKSRRLYTSLGFMRHGAPSHCLEIDPEAASRRWPVETVGLPAVRLDFVSELADVPFESWAAAYNRVFGNGIEVLRGSDLREMLSGSRIAPTLSMLVHETETDRVGGFLLADRLGGGSVRIIVAGLVDELRGRGIVPRAWSSFLQGCRNEGVGKVLFVTGKPGVCAMATRRLGARRKDALVWMLKCSRR
jgi:hypothetical protein